MDETQVLIIDRDAISQKFLTSTLQEQGYIVSQAGSGREGLIFAWRDLPDVIVIDPNLSDLSGEILIQKLRQDPRTASTPIIALSSDPNPELASVSLKQGYSKYLVKSKEAIGQLIEIIARLLSEKGEEEDTTPKSRGRLIVFLSAKGGTGTSSLCANIAMNIASIEPEAKVAVVDMVLPIGSIAPLVGYTGKIDLTTIANKPPEEITAVFLRKKLPKINLWRFQLLAGASTPESANLLQVKRIPDIVDELQKAFDYIVVDLGRSLSRISLPIIQQADLIALILSTDKGTITLTKTVGEYLQSQEIDLHKIYPILNRAIGLEGLTKSEAEDILGLEIRTTVPYMGGNFTVANNQSVPVTHKFPNDTAAFILQQLTEKMINTVRDLHES
ncbi:MAG: hypothetical protein B6I38_02190 [Anaerolineaceae bacterium 4572_5.1]|nr:MAG: hypothetical protein B6I38_02190 [Anaerolineaceae bacterium 4572_5.1]